MATVYIPLAPEGASYLTTLFPEYKNVAGTNIPVTSLGFDATLVEAAFWRFRAARYGSGNLTCDINWYADTAASGTVIWDAALAAITPNISTQNIETDALAAVSSVTATHLGTTNKRLHRATITMTNLDGLQSDDDVALRIRRNQGTMTGDALLTGVWISYSDT